MYAGMVGAALALALASCERSSDADAPVEASAAVVPPAPEAERQPAEDPEPRSFLLLTDRGEYASSEDLPLRGVMYVETSMRARKSTLRITNAGRGFDIHVFNAYGIKEGHEIEGRVGGESPAIPVHLPDGDYRAVWTVNDRKSNVASFRINSAFEIEDVAPLVLLPIVGTDGRWEKDRFLMQFTNLTGEVVDVPEVLGVSAVVADGVTYERRALTWHGPALLPPGKSWSEIISPSGYRVPQQPRRLAFQMAGRTSNELSVAEAP